MVWASGEVSDSEMVPQAGAYAASHLHGVFSVPQTPQQERTVVTYKIASYWIMKMSFVLNHCSFILRDHIIVQEELRQIFLLLWLHLRERLQTFGIKVIITLYSGG